MWELHTIIIDKPIKLNEAKKIAQDIIKDKSKSFYRELENSYHFRNIPKTKFSKFRSKKINEQITLVFGKLK